MKTWLAACQSVTSRHVDFTSGQVTDIQQAEITLLDMPRNLFDLHVIDGPGENGAGRGDGGQGADIEVDPSVAGAPALPEDNN